MDERYREIMRYLIDRIPIILDIEKQELRYDSKNINYKIYKYIHDLKEGNKKE